MKAFFSKKVGGTALLILGVIVLSGIVLGGFISNVYLLIAVLAIQFIVYMIILLFFFDKYVKPIRKASKTMDRLLEGNYKARVHHKMNGTIGELSMKINQLARNLSDLTTLEDMQGNQLSTVIENSESALVLIDEKGYIHIVNRKFVSMFGKSSHDYIGHLYYENIDSEEIHQAVQETFLHEKRVKRSFSHVKDEEKVYFEIVGAPIFNERNNLKGMVLVVYDITELKLLEVMRKDFVANVSHELRTPITSIQGFSETLLDGAAEEKETRDDFLKIIFDESKRIQLLVDDLLILSKLESDSFMLHVSTFDVERLVADIEKVLQRRAKKKQIGLTLKVEEGLTLQADEEKVRQVLLNLLTNALSYTAEGGAVSLTAYNEGEMTCFAVKDSGVGIANEHLSRLFERFYRIDKDRSRNTGGTGLGLAIVKHIVEVHKGLVEVSSELNKGTTFTVKIPK